MSMLDLKIEVRVEVLDDTQEKAVKDAAKQVAKHLKTLCMLMGNKRQPTVALYGSDFFTSEEEIDLADDIDVGITLEGNGEAERA